VEPKKRKAAPEDIMPLALRRAQLQQQAWLDEEIRNVEEAQRAKQDEDASSVISNRTIRPNSGICAENVDSASAQSIDKVVEEEEYEEEEEDEEEGEEDRLLREDLEAARSYYPDQDENDLDVLDLRVTITFFRGQNRPDYITAARSLREYVQLRLRQPELERPHFPPWNNGDNTIEGLSLRKPGGWPKPPRPSS
jgi:hypothetical protein